jgi:hypothetical protein
VIGIRIHIDQETDEALGMFEDRETDRIDKVAVILQSLVSDEQCCQFAAQRRIWGSLNKAQGGSFANQRMERAILEESQA